MKWSILPAENTLPVDDSTMHRRFSSFSLRRIAASNSFIILIDRAFLIKDDQQKMYNESEDFFWPLKWEWIVCDELRLTYFSGYSTLSVEFRCFHRRASILPVDRRNVFVQSGSSSVIRSTEYTNVRLVEFFIVDEGFVNIVEQSKRKHIYLDQYFPEHFSANEFRVEWISIVFLVRFLIIILWS